VGGKNGTILNKNGDRNPHLIFDLARKAFDFAVLSMMIAVCFYWRIFIKLS
jgi:hypothetical protein